MSKAIAPERLAALVGILEPLQYLPLSERVLRFIREAKKAGDEEVFAEPAGYLAPAQGASTTVQTYTVQTVVADGIFLIVSIQHPSPGTADILCTQLQLSSNPVVDDDAIMDAWCDDETSEDARGLPWPLILEPGSNLVIDCSGTGLINNAAAPTPGLTLRGFIVDRATAEVFKAVGMLYVEGFNLTYAAAAVMSTPLDSRQFTTPKEMTHLTAKETLTGDTVRKNVNIVVKGTKLNPRQTNGMGGVVPPLSWRRPGARVSIALDVNDTMQLEPNYTSAGGAGTAKLQMTALGRRRYNC